MTKSRTTNFQNAVELQARLASISDGPWLPGANPRRHRKALIAEANPTGLVCTTAARLLFVVRPAVRQASVEHYATRQDEAYRVLATAVHGLFEREERRRKAMFGGDARTALLHGAIAYASTTHETELQVYLPERALEGRIAGEFFRALPLDTQGKHMLFTGASHTRPQVHAALYDMPTVIYEQKAAAFAEAINHVTPGRLYEPYDDTF